MQPKAILFPLLVFFLSLGACDRKPKKTLGWGGTTLYVAPEFTGKHEGGGEYYHVREDCPKLRRALRMGLETGVIGSKDRQGEPLRYYMKGEPPRIVDAKGFFFDDKFNPCKTCVP